MARQRRLLLDAFGDDRSYRVEIRVREGSRLKGANLIDVTNRLHTPMPCREPGLLLLRRGCFYFRQANVLEFWLHYLLLQE